MNREANRVPESGKFRALPEAGLRAWLGLAMVLAGGMLARGEEPAPVPKEADAQPGTSSKEVASAERGKSAALFQEGLALEKGKDIPGAVAKWEEALKLDARNSPCLNHYAWFLAVTAPAERIDLEKALVLAQRAVEASGRKDHDILDTLAEVHFRRKEYAQAVKIEEEALTPGLSGNASRRFLEQQLQRYKTALGAGRGGEGSQPRADGTGVRKGD